MVNCLNRGFSQITQRTRKGMEGWKNGRVEEFLGWKDGRMFYNLSESRKAFEGGGYAPESSVQILYTPLKNNFY